MAVVRMILYSSALKVTTNCNVLLPDVSNDVSPLENSSCKILYLLHGLSGNAEEWMRFTKLEYYAKKFGYIVVMPEAERSFYTNIDGIQYAKYIAEELPYFLNKWFKIPANKEYTFIAGESMGGYGALKLGLTYPNQYQAIAALSPVICLEELRKAVEDKIFADMDIEEIDQIICQKDHFNIYEYLGKSSAEKLPSILQICGREDFLLENNRKFYHFAKDKLHITYRELDGDHEWPVWDIAIQKAMQYFEGYDIDRFRLY